MKHALLLGLLGLLGLASSAAGAEDGGQAEAWTKLALGARSAALGKAASALKEDLGAAQVNPALLGTLRSFAVGSQLAFLPDGRQLHYLALGRPVSAKSAWSFGASYAQFGFSEPLERRSSNTPEPDGEFRESASAIGLGLAGWAWPQRLALGSTLKLLNHSLADAGGGGVSVDLGAFGHAGPWLDWGLSARDAFSRLGWNTGRAETMPQQWRLGLAFHAPGQPWSAYAEGVLREGQSAGWAHGVEGRLFNERLALRAGLEDGAWRLGLGASAKLGSLDGRLDYALGSDPSSEQSFQHRISLDLDLPL